MTIFDALCGSKYSLTNTYPNSWRSDSRVNKTYYFSPDLVVHEMPLCRFPQPDIIYIPHVPLFIHIIFIIEHLLLIPELFLDLRYVHIWNVCMKLIDGIIHPVFVFIFNKPCYDIFTDVRMDRIDPRADCKVMINFLCPIFEIT